MTRSDGRPLIRQVRYASTSTGLVATRMIPSGLASAIRGTSSRKIAAFFWTRSIRVSPGRWAAPAATTVTAAPWQSSIGPSHTRAVRANGTACMRSIASPSAFRRFASTSRISDARPGQQQPEGERRPDGAGPHDGDAGRVRGSEGVERLRGGHGHTVVHRRPTSGGGVQRSRVPRRSSRGVRHAPLGRRPVAPAAPGPRAIPLR